MLEFGTSAIRTGVDAEPTFFVKYLSTFDSLTGWDQASFCGWKKKAIMWLGRGSRESRSDSSLSCSGPGPWLENGIGENDAGNGDVYYYAGRDSEFFLL